MLYDLQYKNAVLQTLYGTVIQKHAVLMVMNTTSTNCVYFDVLYNMKPSERGEGQYSSLCTKLCRMFNNEKRIKHRNMNM